MTIVLSIILSIVCLLIIVSYLHHYIQLMKEETLIQPLGQLVEVNDHQLHVYTEGNGKETLVFLAGGGTSSPVLDFKSLYTLLSDQYKIVVIEKADMGLVK